MSSVRKISFYPPAGAGWRNEFRPRKGQEKSDRYAERGAALVESSMLISLITLTLVGAVTILSSGVADSFVAL